MKKTLLPILFVLILTGRYVFAGTIYVTKSDYPMALSKSLLEKACRFLADNDPKAFFSLAKTGVIGLTKKGVRVYLEKVHLWDGFIEIRPVGETVVFWTLREAIQKKPGD